MALQPQPELAQVTEYATVSFPVDCATAAGDTPASAGGKASFVRVVDVTSGTTLELAYANGETWPLTVWAGWEMYVEFVTITAGSDVDIVQVGWV
jgi:hypothetical protein